MSSFNEKEKMIRAAIQVCLWLGILLGSLYFLYEKYPAYLLASGLLIFVSGAIQADFLSRAESVNFRLDVYLFMSESGLLLLTGAIGLVVMEAKIFFIFLALLGIVFILLNGYLIKDKREGVDG
jgi:hypothetical protein